LKGSWIQPDTRDEIVDYVRYWSDKTEIKMIQMVRWIGITRSKFYDWRSRYGRINEHNSWIPRDFWLTEQEKQAIIDYFYANPLEGYRRLCYMMMDDDIAAVSPSSVYRVLSNAGLLNHWNGKQSKKGTGFIGPLKAHEHWHIDISYINICGTFYYLCSVLDGFSRYIVHWEIRQSMKESDVEIILQRSREKFPDVTPRIISDNGPQFIARDFKDFIRICGMTHVKTSPYYPQSNGKLERYHRTLKSDCIRPNTPLSLKDAQRVVSNFVGHYNNRRLHSSIDYVSPLDKLEGRAEQILAARETKLAAAREKRKAQREILCKITA
jgi:putative transposase